MEQLEGCRIDEVKNQLHLSSEYQMVLNKRDHKSGEAIKTFTGPDAPKYLYYRDQHYNIINFITWFLRTNAYCTICLEM